MMVFLKKTLAVALAAVLCVAAGFPAMAEMTFEGSVVCEEKVAVSAPFGGTISGMRLRVGDVIELGQAVAQISTTRVYAPADGTISGIFAQPGDGAEGICARYGAVMYVEPTNRYVVEASTAKAYNSSETKYIHMGEKVYLRCTQDGSHTGTAMVTAIKEPDESGHVAYTLEVTGGAFYIGETVAIYRDAEYADASRIGHGTIAQNSAIKVEGGGSVLKIHVSQGESVERGQLLFETVEGTLDGLFATEDIVYSDIGGVVASVDAANSASVSKGSAIIMVYPRSAFQLKVPVSELDLAYIQPGDTVRIDFEWDIDGEHSTTGVVESISAVNAAEGGMAVYDAYINFECDDSVRLGMTVIVHVDQDR